MGIYIAKHLDGTTHQFNDYNAFMQYIASDATVEGFKVETILMPIDPEKGLPTWES